jgi:transcriptional regulator with XRE-family HTH domain
LREEQTFTQKQLAASAELAEKYLSRLELGLATPSVHVAWRLARALDCKIELLLPGSGARESLELLAVTRLLRKRSHQDLERALRILIAVFEPNAD